LCSLEFDNFIRSEHLVISILQFYQGMVGIEIFSMMIMDPKRKLEQLKFSLVHLNLQQLEYSTNP
jgi:hypothetical protein